MFRIWGADYGLGLRVWECLGFKAQGLGVFGVQGFAGGGLRFRFGGFWEFLRSRVWACFCQPFLLCANPSRSPWVWCANRHCCGERIRFWSKCESLDRESPVRESDRATVREFWGSSGARIHLFGAGPFLSANPPSTAGTKDW